ncbi:peptidyl-prolyl cis-trans isomerase [Novosphingobium sp. TH158]|uniref:peptidylprolyl isomerase n=1 Tax=Novosphingobium sp. TH158 TaxID=2067455 RepID=UPI0013047602|nr:peptidylprolyl isomerase [Novosphingobium sp. TH158]
MTLRAILREPLVHFLIAGLALFAWFAWRGTEADPASRTISVDKALVTRLAANWQQTWQRPPGKAELDRLIEDHVREEIYYREALRLGLDRDDTVIRRRLRAKMEFLAQSQADALQPDEAELEAWLRANAARYAGDARLSFDQVYIATGGEARARQVLARLNGGADWRGSGDAISLPASLEAQPRARVAADFGEGFAEALAKAPGGAWQGPVQSGFGLHLVRLRGMAAGRLPPLADVRRQVENDWRAARAQELEQQAFAALRRDYTVRIDQP